MCVMAMSQIQIDACFAISVFGCDNIFAFCE